MKWLMQVPVFFFVVSSVTVDAAENEVLHFEIDLDWKAANTVEKPGHVIIEYVHRGDDINNWKELFTYQNSALRGKHTPEEELSTLKALREKECSGATEWNVIDQNENSILYEWQAKPCLGWRNSTKSPG